MPSRKKGLHAPPPHAAVNSASLQRVWRGKVFTTEELRQDEEEFGSFEEYVKRNGLR